MCNNDRGILFFSEFVHTVRDNSECVNVQTGIGFIQNGKIRFLHRHLENFIPLFLATGKTFVHRTIQETLVHVDKFHPILDESEKINGIQLLKSAMLFDCIEARLQKVSVRNAGDFDRILEGKKYSLTGPFFRSHIEEVLAFIENLAFSDFVRLTDRKSTRLNSSHGY